MPNRIIKESIRESYSIDALCPQAEVLFYRLVTFADDYGLFKADPRLVNKALFPLKDFRESQVTLWLDDIAATGMILFYEVFGKPYGIFTAWHKHQRVRETKPKHPLPPKKGEGIYYKRIIEIWEVCDGKNRQIAAEKIKLPPPAATCRKLPPNPIQSNPIQSKTTSYCSEPKENGSDPPAIVSIPLIKRDGEFHVSRKDIDDWKDTYPGVDVLKCLKEIRQWNKDNPSRRKTKKGIRRHISGWLAREQDKGYRQAGKGSEGKEYNICRDCKKPANLLTDGVCDECRRKNIN